MFFFLMIRRPPRSTRTDTLFPYTTLFRAFIERFARCEVNHRRHRLAPLVIGHPHDKRILDRRMGLERFLDLFGIDLFARGVDADAAPAEQRSEERRVGKECVSTCRSRWSP